MRQFISYQSICELNSIELFNKFINQHNFRAFFSKTIFLLYLILFYNCICNFYASITFQLAHIQFLSSSYIETNIQNHLYNSPYHIFWTFSYANTFLFSLIFQQVHYVSVSIFVIIFSQQTTQSCHYKQMNKSPNKLFLSVKKSFSYLTSSTSTMSADEPMSEESYAFLEKFCSSQKMLSVSIQKVNKATDPLDSTITYASYQISVLTDDVYYKVGKRYSEFKKLFDTVCKYHSLEISFPRKTFWHSGTADCVTLQRQQQLNGFLQQLHKELQQPNVGIPFLKFLELQENYLIRGLSVTNLQSNNKFYINGNIGEFLLLQMHKLNAKSQNIMGVLKQFQRCLIINKVKIQPITIKNLINGSNDYMGLVEIIFTNDNQLVVLEGLTLLTSLLSIEINIFFDRYRKLFQSVPFSVLKELPCRLLQNSQIKKMFFSLISIYVEGKTQQQLTISQIFKQKKQYLKEFRIWQKQLKKPLNNHKLTSSEIIKPIIVFQQFQIQHTQRYKSEKIAQMQKEQTFFYHPNLFSELSSSYQLLQEKRISQEIFVAQLLSYDKNFIQIHSQTTKSYEELKQQLQSLQWCSIFQNVTFPVDNDAIYCSLKNIDKCYRNLKFVSQSIQKTNKYTIYFRPTKEIIGGIIFYIKAQLKKEDNGNLCKLKIIFYMVNTKAKKFFTQSIKKQLLQSAALTFLQFHQ